ncbi:Imidazolonepropionase [Actinopolyspora xinjiangensis]|uniref:Imidazolonepropionase n=1 Tax=Actinopolyspora xinjiangensis TaxID=405564 RepID=A0A1H0S922_9ACTN|nr:amidohydrolase family protein [Actinopolyspora xinjiangensis]SDP38155.1 Imidazolonepropionase [Actinopolyspora xinjiangensis]
MQLITAATVLPGPAGESVPDGAVLVDGGTIRAVGPRSEVTPLAEDAEHVDFPGHTVLPGLINAHVHLAFDTTAEWYTHLNDSDDPDLLLGMAGRAQQALASGVTTLRDLGDRGGLAMRLRDAVDDGELAGPRILSAGSPITVPGGHCWFLGGEVSNESEIRTRVEDHAAAGGDLVKVMASGGSVTPNSPPMWQSQFGLTELRVVVEAARSVGLPVAAHAHGTQSIVDAVEAGVDTIEHATWIAEGGSGSDLREDTARDMAERGIAVCPGWPADWRHFAERIGPERSRAAIERLRWMAERGVPLILGTDAGLRGSAFRNFPNALGLYREIGYSNAEVIELATTTTADALGHGKETGRIAAGYAADLLVVEGDPLADLANLNRQARVLRGGERAVHPA